MTPVLEHINAHILRDRRLAGYRIAIIGDFHLAPWRSTRALSRAIDLIDASEPDLVALVGDYGYSVERLPQFSRSLYRSIMPRVTRELRRLRSHDGVYAVLGNHDVDAGAGWITEALSQAGVHVLRNTYCDISRHQATLRVFGVDDLTRQRRESIDVAHPPWDAAAAVLILSHHPDFVLHAIPMPPSCSAIVVAGHTHGGQIAFPFVGAPVTLSRAATRSFPAGVVPNEKVMLYVSRGLGEQIPLRIRARREITLLQLALR